MGSRSRLPERAITTVQALGDRKIPQSYGKNMTFISTKLASSRFAFILCIFSMLIMITTYFSTVELGS